MEASGVSDQAHLWTQPQEGSKLTLTCKPLTLSHTSVVEPDQDANYAMMIEHFDFLVEIFQQPSIPAHTTCDRVERQSAEMRYGLKFFATAHSSHGGHLVKRRERDSDLDEEEVSPLVTFAHSKLSEFR